MRKINFSFILNLLLICSAVTSNSEESAVQSQITYSNSYIPFQYNPPKPDYPSYRANPQTSKLKTTVSGLGIIGNQPNFYASTGGFEFPAGRKINYMYFSGLWVGGIVENDTLVSTAICKELVDNRSGYQILTHLYDFHPQYINNDTATTTLYTNENEQLIHTTFTDTLIPFYSPYSTYIEKHRPMGLHVTMKSYTKNLSPFKNIVLIDYIITNKSSKTINSAFVGMYVNTYVQGSYQPGVYEYDDLVGSIQDKGVAYIMDNDGDLNISNCPNGQASGSMALKTMTTYPPPPDTNFNWWSNYNLSYAPQKKDSLSNLTRIIGPPKSYTPTGDSNRYYIMSNNEWDFDQYLTKQEPLRDTTWAQADDSTVTSISKGNTPNFLLSLGPIDLQPDSSIRTVFALIGTDLIHINKNNYFNLLYEYYNNYYSNLFFDLFYDNLNFANSLAEDYLNPFNKPISLQEQALSATSTLLSWDNYVFPEVIGYNIHLKEIPDYYFLTSEIVRPDLKFNDVSTEEIVISTNTNEFILENLQIGKKYLVVVAHETLTEEGNYSDPIIVGDFNPFIKPEKVTLSQEYTPIHPDQNLTTFRWIYPENNNIAYYKIYKAKDSLLAVSRFTPFLHSERHIIPLQPKRCFNINDSTICFYEMPTYDSVSSDIQQYTDSIVSNGAYYWITAVNEYGIESELSQFVKTTTASEITKDIVAIIGSSYRESDYVYEDSILQYYTQLLAGYDYDIVKWTDSVFTTINCTTSACVSWEDISKYKLVIINEFPSPKILTKKTESQTKLFTKLSDLGHNIAYFGIPPGDKLLNISEYTDSILYDELSFERTYMGIDCLKLRPWFGNYDFFGAIDSLGGFNAAIPNNQSMPMIDIKSDPTFFKPFIKQLFIFENYIPFTPIFIPTEDSEILYRYQSAYEETSELQGLPVGISHKNKNNQFFTFGFHLWAMKLPQAKELISFLFQKQSQHVQAIQIPDIATIYQNYPNPFNAETNISFSLPDNFNVSLDIYNIIGQKIETLIDHKPLPAGIHYISWDGKNGQNNDVATGIYFYKLTIDDYQFSKKMLLLK